MKRILLLTLCLLLCACAARSPRPAQIDDNSPWQKMLLASKNNEQPYRLQMSMRFGEEGNTRRVTAVMWGNADQRLRLDIMAGVGAILAKISENPDSFLLLSPRENKAYWHEGLTRPMLKIGVPVPFDLRQLADLLNGRFAQVFGEEYVETGTPSDTGVNYELDGPLAGLLELNAEGLPVAWKQKSGGWSLKIAYDPDQPAAPKSLRLTNVNGRQAVILVKQREILKEPFTREQLTLTLPPGVKKLPLADYRPS